MEEESLVWASKDVVIVLEHNNEKIPLRYFCVSVRQRYSMNSCMYCIAQVASVFNSLYHPFAVTAMCQKRLGSLLFRLSHSATSWLVWRQQLAV